MTYVKQVAEAVLDKCMCHAGDGLEDIIDIDAIIASVPLPKLTDERIIELAEQYLWWTFNAVEFAHAIKRELLGEWK